MKTTLTISAFLILCCAAFGQTHTEMDLESNQTATGAKTFTGGVTSNTLNVSGLSTLSGGVSQGSFERDCRQDGTLDVTAVADSSATINACVAAAKAAGQSRWKLPSGQFLVNTTLNLTNFIGGHLYGTGFQGVSGAPILGEPITQLVCNTGATPCIDTTGSSGIEIDHLNIKLCCTGITNFSTIGILMGRDNAGGGGAANPLCYQQFYHIHDIYITDNGGGNTTFNGGRGQIGIYNLGAENGLYENVDILTGTTMLFTQTNLATVASPYQTIQTGCPFSMTGVTLIAPNLTASTTTLPLIESNITNGFTIKGIQGVGGIGLVKFENLSGGTPTTSWFIDGLYEQGVQDVISTSVSLTRMDFHIQVSTPPPGFLIRMGGNNLTFLNSDFLFDDVGLAVPFIDNASTGTLIKGSRLIIAATTSAANTTVTSSEVYAPGVTDANITFNAASNYDRFNSSGISTIGERLFSAGSVATPGLGIGVRGTGWNYNASGHVQNSDNGVAGAYHWSLGIVLGNLMGLGFSPSNDPNNSGADALFSRPSPNFIVAGNGTVGNASGVFASDGNTVALTADWTCGTGGTVASCTAATIIGSGGGVPLTFTLPLVARSWTWECDGVVGQATAATANSWNFLTATNGATNVTANYTMNTAATAMTGGATTDQASTTTTVVIGPTWTLGGTATKMPFHIWGRIEGASASGTVLSLQLVAPTVGDMVTIYRGSSCKIR